MSHRPYTKREDSLIAEYLPKIGYAGLLKMLPHRTQYGLADRVKVLRLRGAVIGIAYVESKAAIQETAEADELIIKDNLTKVGYRGLIKMLPHRSYHWIKKRICLMRATGVISKSDKVPRFRSAPVAKREPLRESTSPYLPCSPGWRHARYMAGESVGCV